MSAPVCSECLEPSASLDAAGVCPVCRDRLRLEAAYGDGWRSGWAACEAFYRIDRATGEVSS